VNLGRFFKKAASKVVVAAELVVAIRDAVKGVFKKKKP